MERNEGHSKKWKGIYINYMASEKWREEMVRYQGAQTGIEGSDNKSDGIERNGESQREKVQRAQTDFFTFEFPNTMILGTFHRMILYLRKFRV